MDLKLQLGGTTEKEVNSMNGVFPECRLYFGPLMLGLGVGGGNSDIDWMLKNIHDTIGFWQLKDMNINHTIKPRN